MDIPKYYNKAFCEKCLTQKHIVFYDPFDTLCVKKDNYMIHVRIQKRNGRKIITTVEGI